MSTTIVSYLGRTVDFSVFHTVGNTEETAMALFLPGTGGKVCTGIRKLAQRMLLLLLTKKGSVKHLQTKGTIFMLDAMGWRTTGDVQRSFVGAKIDLIRQLAANEEETDPLDEQIDDIELLSVSVSSTAIDLRLKLTSKAKNVFEFIAPVPFSLKT